MDFSPFCTNTTAHWHRGREYKVFQCIKQFFKSTFHTYTWICHILSDISVSRGGYSTLTGSSFLGSQAMIFYITYYLILATGNTSNWARMVARIISKFGYPPGWSHNIWQNVNNKKDHFMAHLRNGGYFLLKNVQPSSILWCNHKMNKLVDRLEEAETDNANTVL